MERTRRDPRTACAGVNSCTGRGGCFGALARRDGVAPDGSFCSFFTVRPATAAAHRNVMSERLHKLLAQHGLGSRREIEKWILEGRVLLNGRPAQTGDRYEPGDRVAIDGKDVSARLKITAAPQVLIYHKSQGQSITADAPDDVDDSDATLNPVMESLPAVRG